MENTPEEKPARPAKSEALETAMQKLAAKTLMKKKIALEAMGYRVNEETGEVENIFDKMREEGESEEVVAFFEDLHKSLAEVKMRHIDSLE